MTDNPTSGFVQQAVRSDLDLDEKIIDAWRNYVVETLGQTRDYADDCAQISIRRTRGAQVVRQLADSGVCLAGARAIDVGSGLGDVALELARAGATVTAVEPCDSWRAISEERGNALGLALRHVGADAHELPFPNESFDICVSLQVLEHVRSPRRVLSEMARVLRPGGYFFLTCENYLAFRENHYGVAWLPGLPKWLAACYLRLRGRNPEFLRKHVTFTYWPRLLAWCVDDGLIDELWQETCTRVRENRLGRKERFMVRAIRCVAGEQIAVSALLWKIYRWNMFQPGFRACGYKHPTPARVGRPELAGQVL